MMLLICLLICIFYADDINLYLFINTTLSREHLNYAINNLCEWTAGNVWQLQIAVLLIVCNAILTTKDQILICIITYLITTTTCH